MIKSITGHGSDGMLEHDQRIGAGLAAEMATRIGNGTLKPLPPHPVRDPETESPTLESVRQIVEFMTPESLEQDRQRILTMLNTATG